MQTDAAIAFLLLGAEAAQELYGCSETTVEEQLRTLTLTSSMFLLRLRTLLKMSCANLGLDTVCTKLQLPVKIATYIKTGSVDPQPVKRQKAEPPPFEDHRENGELTITPEQRQQAVTMYDRGVNMMYIAALFGVVNMSVIHSWGDWRRLPKQDAAKNTEKRRAIQDRIAKGDSPQTIRLALRIKDRVYRDLMGTPIGVMFTYNTYEVVKKQMAIVNFDRVVSRNTGVPMYFIKRWMEGFDIPPRPLIETDEDGLAENKWTAIEKYYETGSSMMAADAIGATNPQLVERWVEKFQRRVDERGVTEPRE